MLMRPAPSHATAPSAPSPSVSVTGPLPTTFGTGAHRVHPGHPGLEQGPRRAPVAIALAFVLPSATPRQLFHLPAPPVSPNSPNSPDSQGQRTRHRSVAQSQTPLAGGPTCGNCRTDHRSFPRSRHVVDANANADGTLERRNGRVPRNAFRARAQLQRAAVHGGRGPLVPQVLDRVPFHAAFADDPAFHRPDQGVVADDNTENHQPSNYDAKLFYSTTTDAPDTTTGRVPGGRHRRRHKGKRTLAGISPPREDQVEEKKEETAFEPLRRSPEEGCLDPLEIRCGERRQRPGDAERSKHGRLDVAQVPQATRPQPRRHLRSRQTARRVNEKTCGLVFLLYLLALPILCATNGSPAGNRSPLGSAHTQHNSSHRNASPTAAERHPYRDYSWEVNQINPWLSACDLAGPAPADLQGSCGPPETPKNCPDACHMSADSPFAVVSRAIENRGASGGGGGGRAAPEQCLYYLDESHKTEICRNDFGSRNFGTVRENRYHFLSGLRLRHCCEHTALNALAPGDGGPLEDVLGGNEGCRVAIGKLLAVDALAARLHCEFGEVLARYDCGQPYSVIYNCTHCKEAYRRWVCSSLVPYFAHDDSRQDNHGLAGPRMGTGMRIRPCRSFCQSVEQRCPYLLPGDRAPAYPTQYAGEPTFLCRDPNIPETGEQASRALHADEECCFHVCSDEDPGRGVCANCTEPQIEIDIRGGNARRDPSTAPQCEPSTTASSSGQHPWPEPGVVAGTNIQVSGTSFCGTGAVGSMSSGAAPRTQSGPLRRITAAVCAFCAWGAIIGLCTGLRTCSWTPDGSTPSSGGSARNRPRPRGRPFAETVYLVVKSSFHSISSLLLVTFEMIGRLSSTWYALIGLKLKRKHGCRKEIRVLLDANERGEDHRLPRNYKTRPRRRHSRGSKRRRKKKRGRAS